MRKHHVKDKLASKSYISINKANRLKQDAQERAFMKDEDEIKRFLREQRNQWRKESKFKGRQRTEEEVAEDEEDGEDGEEDAEEEGEDEESSEQEEESSQSEDEEFASAAKPTKR